MNKLKRIILRNLVKIRPKKSKRLIVVSALIPTLRKNKEIDEDTLRRINNALYLSSGTSAMKLPIYMSDDIWEEAARQFIEKELEEDRCDTLTSYIYNTLPEWLRYDYKTLRRDVEVLAAFKQTQSRS